MGADSYAGDIDAEEAYRLLREEPTAVLVDVRTRAEWAYVGLPDLTALGKEPVLIEWQRFPDMDVDAAFAPKLAEILSDRAASRESAVLFLCRSGARSRAAAQALTALGYSRCFNIAGGFEGPLDDAKQRGHIDGWKAKHLPWAQS
jgi:rhodanese-related sulfurtransferase